MHAPYCTCLGLRAMLLGAKNAYLDDRQAALIVHAQQGLEEAATPCESRSAAPGAPSLLGQWCRWGEAARVPGPCSAQLLQIGQTLPRSQRACASPPSVSLSTTLGTSASVSV